jgi:uncharacterized protein (TIGR02284 family)
MMIQEEVIAGLNDLVEICLDSQKGFEEAAYGVRFAEYRTLFESFAQERALFVTELQNLVRHFGGDPVTSGTASGTLHRGWMEVTSIVSGESESAILGESVQGENTVLQNYEEAIQKDWPNPPQATLQRQYLAIKQAYNKLQTLLEVVPDTQEIP